MRRVAPAAQEGAATPGPEFANDQDQDHDEEDEGDIEEYGRLHHAVAVDGDAVAGLQGAEHGDQVLAHMHVFSQADAAEHAYQVVVDGGVVVRRDAAEEIHHVMVSLAGDVRVPKEDHHIAGGFAFDVDAAEEADGIVDGGTGRDVDVGKELDFVLLGAGGGRRKGCAEKENREDAADHGELHSSRVREMGRESSWRVGERWRDLEGWAGLGSWFPTFAIEKKRKDGGTGQRNNGLRELALELEPHA